MKNEPKTPKDRWKDTWNANLNVGGSVPYFAPIISKLGDLFSRHDLQGRLLDLGCGYGNKSFIFDALGFDVTGIDGDSSRVAKAQEMYPHIDFKVEKIDTQLPFDDGTFDIVFTSSVLQYLEHEPILKECNRILKKGGRLVMVENLKNNPVTRTGRAFLKLKKHNYHSYPWNHFTFDEVAQMKNEFEDSSVSTFYLLSPLAKILLLKWSYPLLFRLDRWLLSCRPLRKWAWIVVFYGVKK